MCPPPRRDFLTTIAASAILLLGCTPRASLRVAVHPWVGYETMFLARQHGWLDPERVRLVETPSASDSVHLLGHGLVEAAALTLDEVLRACALGLRLAVPLVFDVSVGADGVLARQPLRLTELAGARIGVEQSAVGAMMLAAVLEQAGMSAQDVQLIHLHPNEHIAAWRADKIDVLITFEPMLSALEVEGAVRIFDSRAMPDTIVDVLAIRQQALASHGPAIRHLVMASLRAVRDLTINPFDGAYRIGARLGQRPETVLAGLRGLLITDVADNRRLLTGASPLLAARAREVASILRQAGILPLHPDAQPSSPLDLLVTADYLPDL
ncbi:MAG: ABC transporter substrate-binding protein [Gammaproteobacteria bacterium]|nr:ABC transporter substrate-binding protein [Gammaproteobacteria bacterium]